MRGEECVEALEVFELTLETIFGKTVVFEVINPSGLEREWFWWYFADGRSYGCMTTSDIRSVIYKKVGEEI